MKNLRSRLTFWHLFLVVSILFLVFKYNQYGHWKDWKTPFVQDADQYYSYLTSTFIHHDSYFHFPNSYWLASAANGEAVPRYTMGVAVMEAPFFFSGDAIARLFNYPVDGYSPPYVWSICFGVMLYVFTGLYFLYRLLLFYTRPVISILVVAAVFYSTNLFYYTISWGVMSHSFGFTMFCIFLFSIIKFYKEKAVPFLFIAAFAAGMMTLIRPPDIIVLLIPLLLGIHSKDAFREWRLFLWSKKSYVVLASVLFLLTVCPQLIYWKLHTGQFLFYGYGDEHFYFKDPQVVNFLFGYRKGLIPYSPVMILAFLGFPVLYWKNRELFWPLFLFNVLNIYVLSCWWDWSFGGGFGNRALIQSYAALAIPMAALLNALFLAFKAQWMRRVSLVAITSVLLFFSTFNLWIIRKYMNGIIHWGYMTEEAYWFVMTKNKFTPEDKAALEKMYRAPDLEGFKNGTNRDDK